MSIEIGISVNSSTSETEEQDPAASVNNILIETGDNILLEDGSYLLLEG